MFQRPSFIYKLGLMSEVNQCFTSPLCPPPREKHICGPENRAPVVVLEPASAHLLPVVILWSLPSSSF